jgi:hypothetical protein
MVWFGVVWWKGNGKHGTLPSVPYKVSGTMVCQLLMTHYKNCRQPAEVYAPSVQTVNWKSYKS